MQLPLATMKLPTSVLFLMTLSQPALPSVITDNYIGDEPPLAPMPTVVPIQQLREGRHVLGSSQEYMQEFPPWVNRTLLAIGQKFLRENFVGFAYAGELTGFLVGVDTQRVLFSGGNTSDSINGSRRYLVNAINFWHWAVADLGTEEIFEGLNLIQAVHTKMGYETNCRYKMFEKPLIPEPKPGDNPYKLDQKAWEAFERDLIASPLRHKFKGKELFPPRDGGTRHPLNQFAMATQLWAFIGSPVMAPEQVLIPQATDEELWGYLHFWAFIGKGLGIEDQYNVCMQSDLATARAYFRDILYEYVAPPLLDLSYEQKVFIETAFKSSVRIIRADSIAIVAPILYRMCVDLLGIDCPHLRRSLDPMGRGVNLLVNVANPISRFSVSKSALNLFINGLIGAQSFKEFGFHSLFQSNFSRGILDLNREVLRTSNVHWKGAPSCPHNSFIN